MIIKSPYTISEHKVYPRTFLQKAQVKIKFDKQEGALHQKDTIHPFLSNQFAIKNQEIPDSVSCIQLSSPDGLIVCRFTNHSAETEIHTTAYHSFNVTLVPLIQKLIAYAQEVCGATLLQEITVYKNNVWEIETTQNIKDVYSSALLHTFKESYIKDFRNMNVSGEFPFSSSQESRVNLGDGNLKISFTTNLSNEHQAFFNLDLTATADSVPLTETESVFEELNKACYGAFVDWINDDILKLMEKEGGLHETLQQ